MRVSGFGRRALTGCVTLVILAGCGGSQPPISATGAMAPSQVATQDHKDYDVRGPLLYVTDITENVVNVYHADGKLPAPFRRSLMASTLPLVIASTATAHFTSQISRSMVLVGCRSIPSALPNPHRILKKEWTHQRIAPSIATGTFGLQT